IGHWLVAKSLARLRDRALRDQSLASPQSQVQGIHHPFDRFVPQPRHPQHHPHPLICRQPPPTHRRGSRHLQRFIDPHRIDVPLESLEIPRNYVSDALEGLIKSHRRSPWRDRLILIPSPISASLSFSARKADRFRSLTALTDRHW